MAQIRCVKNIILEVVTPNGETIEKMFSYGYWYSVSTIEMVDDDYMNITLEDGSLLKDISRHLFELHKARKIVKIKEKEDVPREGTENHDFTW